MARSIIDTISLAVTVAFAAPIGLAGANLFLGGDRLIGGVLFAVAVLMIAFEEFLLTPKDIPLRILKRFFGFAVLNDPDEE